jgi:RNA polymerase sigma-70 factor (ECF subfamily)
VQLLLALFSVIINRTERAEADKDLLRRIAGGDESALSDLYDQYGQLLFTFAMRTLRSLSDAEEILQEVFLQVWNKANLYQNEKGTVYTWLVTMTRNKSIDRLRSKGYKKHDHHVDINTVTLVAESAALNPLANAVLQDEQKLVGAVLRQLNKEQQQVLALAYYDGYTQSEIAEKLGIPIGTVKSRMRKGLMNLRSLLQEKM